MKSASIGGFAVQMSRTSDSIEIIVPGKPISTILELTDDEAAGFVEALAAICGLCSLTKTDQSDEEPAH